MDKLELGEGTRGRDSYDLLKDISRRNRRIYDILSPLYCFPNPCIVLPKKLIEDLNKIR